MDTRNRIRLGIGAKLALSFALVLALVAVLSWAGLRAAREAGDSAAEIGERDLALVAEAGEATALGLRVRELALLHTLAGPAELGQLEAEIRAADQSFAERLETLAALAHAPGQVALVATLEADWLEYVRLRDELTLTLSRAGDVAGAREAAAGAVGERFARARAGLNALAAEGRESATTEIAAATERFSDTESLIYALIAVAGVLGLGTALVASRRVGGGIRAVAVAAQELAAGDLARRAPVRGRDEVALLAESFNAMAGELEAHERRRRAVSDLQRLALATRSLDPVLEEAVELVSRTLEVDCAAICEHLAGKDTFAVRASICRDGEHAELELTAGSHPHTAYTLSAERPVVIDDVAADTRFEPPVALLEFGVVSAIGVPVQGRPRRPFGVLEAHSRRRRVFGDDDARFLEEIAGVLAAAIARRGVEEALEASEARFRSLIQNSSDLTLLLDESARIVFASPSAARVAGCSPDELVGRSAFDFVHEDDLGRIVARLEQVAAEPGSLATAEFRALGPGESAVYLDGTALNLVDNPAVGAIVVNARDVSERRRAEADSARLEEQLRQSQRLESVGRLAGGIAHDFNNLLTAILGYLDLLRDETAEVAGEYLDEMAKAAERGAALVSQLLAFSRRQVLRPRVLDLNEVVDDLEPMLRRVLGETIDLRVVTSPGIRPVRADPHQLGQVIVNLAVNARDAMPDGGVLTIETQDVCLDEEYASCHAEVEPGEYVLLAVSDTGAGMDERTRTHAFEPFFTTKEPGQGTGLGLATVHGIVKQSGGHVWLYSEPGAGASFKIYLPASSEPAEALHGEAWGGEGGERGTETILVVEDDPTVRSLAVRILEEHGYTVLEACDGPEAIALAGAHRGTIDLVLSDVVLPGMSGREVVDRITAACPGVKALFMSGYTENAIVHDGTLDADTAFIQKPFRADTLARWVRRVLDAGRDAASPGG